MDQKRRWLTVQEVADPPRDPLSAGVGAGAGRRSGMASPQPEGTTTHLPSQRHVGRSVRAKPAEVRPPSEVATDVHPG